MFLVLLHNYVYKGQIKDTLEDKRGYPSGHSFVIKPPLQAHRKAKAE